MGKGHRWLPKPAPLEVSKLDLLTDLQAIDSDEDARRRVLSMETDFRGRVGSHLDSLPTNAAQFDKFKTNPFVLLFYAYQQEIRRIHEMETAILPAKAFSSMETSAGKMLEQVTFPVYGWEIVESEMHSANSALDGTRTDGDTLRLATLKSGPRCLNDEMSGNFADAIIANAVGWAQTAAVERIDFTYGVLYGTKKQSNKKDWHILRNIFDKMPAETIRKAPEKRWTCGFAVDGVEVDVTVRVGSEWWTHLGGSQLTLTELAVALIRACVEPFHDEHKPADYAIADLADIVADDVVPEDFNVSLLQRSQIEWLFFVMSYSQ